MQRDKIQEELFKISSIQDKAIKSLNKNNIEKAKIFFKLQMGHLENLLKLLKN